MGNLQLDKVAESLGIPEHVLVSEVGLPVIGALLAIFLGGINCALFSSYLWEFWKIEDRVRLSTVSAAVLCGLIDVMVLFSFIYDKSTQDPNGDFRIQHGEYFVEGLINFLAQGTSQLFFLRRLDVFPSLRTSPLVIGLGFAIAVETLIGIVSEALVFTIADYRDENKIKGLDPLRVFPLVLGILIDMTITFKLVSNIRRLDDKFSDVKKILERHNMIACAAMTLVATGCTLIFAATRSVGMMSILRFPLPQVNILCMLATLLSRQTVRKEVPRTVRKRGRRMFSLRRASRVLSTGAAGCDNKQGPNQEIQEESAATGDNRPPPSSNDNEEANDPLSIHPEQQLQHRRGHQHGDGANPDGISEPKPKPEREPEREQNHDQDQEPRQSSADRSLYHRSSIIGS